MTDAEKKVWNAAIKAAAEAVVRAPVFPKRDEGPAMDAERIRVLDTARKQICALTR